MKKLVLVAFFAALSLPATASAFCGFYVGGGGAELFNDATQVVLVREGTRTTLSMQNRYQGPAEGFAMVVPVPQVLTPDDVKTLDEYVFTKVDELSSPRLVEYEEQDPCYGANYDEANNAWFGNNASAGVFDAGFASDAGAGEVTVEAQFKEGEYDIAILSATESTALETYLKENNYAVPSGAGPYYQPYIDAGMYFFVAKVDPAEVAFDADGNAILSPLRFSYDTNEFQLPIRLGMLNSNGKQDLLVYILAREQRYDVANYPNVTIPTNIEVTEATKDDFGNFYKSLFARTVQENPGAVVTEYAWSAAGCDPCPPGGVTLNREDLLTLGVDDDPWGWVVTRLHARYDKDEVGEDLVFRKAEAIVGGREVDEDGDGEIDQGSFADFQNNFQPRYIIRRPWTGPVTCDNPQWGNWTAPSVQSQPSPNTTGDDVFGGDPASIGALVVEDIEELGIEGTGRPPLGTHGGFGRAAGDGEKAGAACTTGGAGALAPFGLLLLGAFAIRRRRNS
jgi:MYXO-CTERM domain-containing protein